MKWTTHGERSIYSSRWVDLNVIDVEVPGHGRFDHHVVRMPRPAAGVVIRHRGSVLLMWRHRLLTDTWGWEIPAGGVDADETPGEAARREAIEETGWSPRSIDPLAVYHPTNGLSDQTFHLFTSNGADRLGKPSDPAESERIEWVDWDDAMALVREGAVRDGMSLTGLLYAHQVPYES